MEAAEYRWSEVEEDNPIPLLKRRRIFGEKSLIARVELAAGCDVAIHQHESEQTAIVLSGHVRWFLGHSREQREMRGGEVMQLPSNFPHGLVALQDSVIIDVLSPPGAMGVDSQG